eukprot:c9813_g1_i2.p1 GENE.c9813_g1_i2~~c9813_g1_i2.p1  ORF type:complete len:1575 (-),score=412.74 c9813_g1_i2:156-4232(-)
MSSSSSTETFPPATPMHFANDSVDDDSGTDGSERKYMIRRLLAEVERSIGSKAPEMQELWWNRIFVRLLLPIAYPAAVKRVVPKKKPAVSLELTGPEENDIWVGYTYDAAGFEVDCMPRVLQVEIVTSIQKWLTSNAFVSLDMPTNASFRSSEADPGKDDNTTVSRSLKDDNPIRLMMAVIEQALHHPHYPPTSLAVPSLFIYSRWLTQPSCRPSQIAGNFGPILTTIISDLGSLLAEDRMTLPQAADCKQATITAWESASVLLLCAAQNCPSPTSLGSSEHALWEAVFHRCLAYAKAFVRVFLEQSDSGVVRAFEVAVRGVYECLVRVRACGTDGWVAEATPELRYWLSIDLIGEAVSRQWECTFIPLAQLLIRLGTLTSEQLMTILSPSISSVAPPIMTSYASFLGALESGSMHLALAAVFVGSSNDKQKILPLYKAPCDHVDAIVPQLTEREALCMTRCLITLVCGALSKDQPQRLKATAERLVWCMDKTWQLLLDNSRVFKLLTRPTSASTRASMRSLIMLCVPSLHAIALASDSFPAATRAEAVRMTCEYFVKRATIDDFDKNAHGGVFCEVVLGSLASKEVEVVSAIIVGCSELFCIDLVLGSHLLLVPLLSAIAHLPMVSQALKKANSVVFEDINEVGSLPWNTLPLKTLALTVDAALTLVFSVLSFPNVFANLVELPFSTSKNLKGVMEMPKLRTCIVALMLRGFSEVNGQNLPSPGAGGVDNVVDGEHIRRRWIWGLTVLVREHLRCHMDEGIPTTVRSHLLECAVAGDNEVTACTACDALVEMANVFHSSSFKLANEFVIEVVARMCAHVVGKVTADDATQQRPDPSKVNAPGANAEHTLWTLLSVCLELDSEMISSPQVLPPIMSTAVSARKSSITNSTVLDTATVVLDELVRVLHTFPRPSPLLPDVLSSTVSEPLDQSVITLVREGSIVSMCNTSFPSHENEFVHIVVRDRLGKHSWRVCNDVTNAPVEEPHFNTTNTQPATPPIPSRDLGPSFEDVLGECSMGHEGAVDCDQLKSWWNRNSLPLKTEEIHVQASNLEKSHATCDRKTHHVTASELPDPTGWGHTRALMGHVLRMSRPDHATSTQARTREMFLQKTHPKYDQLMRNLRFFDDARPRECHKIGVIYVAPGFEDQLDIMKIEGASDGFRSFVDGLGWQVALDAHQGWNGKLDRHLTTGTHAPYYADPLREVIFHVTAQMPTVTNDPQQIHKKRHVGNDQVQVVFTEHSRDYRPETIVSQFNDAHVIVYPLSRDRYRIQTYTKKELYGPLCNGMVVHRSMGALLVRRTAINADCMVRRAQYGHSNPFSSRKKLLQDLVSKFCEGCSADAMLARMFDLSLPAPSSAPAS